MLTQNRHTAEQYLSQYILPLPSKGDDEVAWTEQLLVTIRHLEPSKIAALTALSAIGLACVLVLPWTD